MTHRCFECLQNAVEEANSCLIFPAEVRLEKALTGKSIKAQELVIGFATKTQWQLTVHRTTFSTQDALLNAKAYAEQY